MKFCLFLLLALTFAPSAAAAQKALESTFELSAPVAAGSRVKYLDLVRLVFPDADDGSPAITRRSIPLRHAGGDYKDRIFTGDMSIDYVERVFIRGGGERLAVLLIHVSPVTVLRPSSEIPLPGGGVEKVAPVNPEPARATPREEGDGDFFTWGGISVLAAFRLTPAPRLLDAFDVRADRETHLWEKHPATALGARDGGVWFVNAHHNAGEEFRSYALAGYGAGGLKLILARAAAPQLARLPPRRDVGRGRRDCRASRLGAARRGLRRQRNARTLRGRLPQARPSRAPPHVAPPLQVGRAPRALRGAGLKVTSERTSAWGEDEAETNVEGRGRGAARGDRFEFRAAGRR